MDVLLIVFILVPETSFSCRPLAKSYAALTALAVAANDVLVLFVADDNFVTPYLLVDAAGILATPLVATDVPFAETPVIVPAFLVNPHPLTVDSVTALGIVGLSCKSL